MFYITDDMRETYSIHDKYSIFLDYGSFVQADWNEWSVFMIEGIAVYAVN
jgi:hypothetical protein